MIPHGDLLGSENCDDCEESSGFSPGIHKKGSLRAPGNSDSGGRAKLRADRIGEWAAAGAAEGGAEGGAEGEGVELMTIGASVRDTT